MILKWYISQKAMIYSATSMVSVTMMSSTLTCKELRDYCTKLIDFKENLAKKSDYARFWFSFLEIIEILLNLIYATRSGNWHLYVESLRSTLPWFVAYDRTNYSRYLTTHYIDAFTLKSTHPDLYHFQKGNFPVQISEKYTFGRMEADKVIETTINRDTKTPGRTTDKKHFNEASLAFLNNLHLLINKFCILKDFFGGDFNE